MRGSLTEQQVQSWHTDGYVTRVPVLSPDECETWRNRLENIEAEQEALERERLRKPGLAGVWQQARHRGPWWTTRSYQPHQHGDNHPMKAFTEELVRHPAIVAALKALLGPNVLARNADVFTRDVGSKVGVTWHRDVWTSGEKMANVWLGLSKSTDANGGMWFLPGSHRVTLPEEPTSKWNLNLTKRALTGLDMSTAVPNVMEAGMMSIHHMRLVHMSKKNITNERRIGFVIRAIADDADPAVIEAAGGFLICGTHRSRRTQIAPGCALSWNT